MPPPHRRHLELCQLAIELAAIEAIDPHPAQQCGELFGAVMSVKLIAIVFMVTVAFITSCPASKGDISSSRRLAMLAVG
jgi:hypothetical protein